MNFSPVDFKQIDRLFDGVVINGYPVIALLEYLV